MLQQNHDHRLYSTDWGAKLNTSTQYEHQTSCYIINFVWQFNMPDIWVFLTQVFKIRLTIFGTEFCFQMDFMFLCLLWTSIFCSRHSFSPGVPAHKLLYSIRNNVKVLMEMAKLCKNSSRHLNPSILYLQNAMDGENVCNKTTLNECIYCVDRIVI